MTETDKKNYLLESFSSIGVSLSAVQVSQFLLYDELLREWNQKMNLTSISEYEDVVWKHFVDSASVLRSSYVSRETWNANIIDVGTGAGFPGIPLKIVFPDCKLTLLDSLNKRVMFLDEVVKKCNLKKVFTVHGRAEDYGHDAKYREKYDICVSRAVAHLSTLTEYCLPFIKRGGYFVAYKADDIGQELQEASKAIKVFGGAYKHTETFTIKNNQISRNLIYIRKVNSTPKKYPRKAGTPNRKPIK